ncbi:MAG TPA: M28 family peptidase [Bryobacteraceae bacterium]|nr:M28 family peptidase [Bryobacteraceae bacterium]
MRFFLWLIPLALPAADISPQPYMAEVRYLASPELKGRATGSPELEKAARFIAGKFKSFGLKPADGKNFELAFPVTLGAHLGPHNSLTFHDPEPGSLEPQKDFVPFSFSSVGKLNAPVVFAGYGITDKEKNYDDYAGIDVTGKIVLIFRHEPKEGAKLSDHAAFTEKAVNAKMHGAKGVILINDTFAHAGKPDELEKFRQAEGPTDVGVLFVQMKEADAERFVETAHTTLGEAYEKINHSMQPDSFALPEVTVDLDVDVHHEVKTVHNVAGYLPGDTPEYVVVGAHYDHLGLGDEHSLAPSQIGQIHPGADDNASGTAGVIELARWFSKQPKQKRGILFLTFAGEELGLLGSEWYVNHPALPLKDAVAMINMDMIGRIREGKVYLSGTGTGSTFPQLIDQVKPPASLHIDLSEKTGYGASDHTSFTTKQVPVLFFFSGLHGDYHKPSDTADKIDPEDAALLLDYIADLMTHLEADPTRPQFERVAEPTEPTTGGGGSGYGPNFGSIPDFNEPPKGVRFADVRDGTPAAKAGLKAGDILIEFDGKPIGNLYDFTYALRAHKPGDLVLVKVIRGSQTIEAKVLLTERR